MAVSNFTYSTTIAGSPLLFGWSSATNWNPAVPGAASNVVIQSNGTKATVDDIATLSVKSLTVGGPTFIAGGNTLTVTGQVPTQAGIGVVNNATITLLAGASLKITGSGDSGIYNMVGTQDSIRFGNGDFTNATLNFDGTTGNIESLILNNPTVNPTSTATITGFGVSDAIVFNNASFASATHVVQSGSSLLLEDASSSVLYTFNTFSEASSAPTLGVLHIGAGVEIVAVCFAEGTRIATAEGETPVEALSEGDMVATLAEDGATVLRPVKWVGRRHLDLTAHARPEQAAPVRILAGAFAARQPARDLVVSPDHCLFVDGKLIPAKLLVNGASIVQEHGRRAVTYFHVELDRHAVLLAEGLPAESYLDTGNRAFFANAGLALILHPDFQVNSGLRCWAEDACAPLAVSAAAVAPVWTRLAERAAAQGLDLPRHATTTDADAHLLVGGRAIRAVCVTPVPGAASRHVFVLPRGTDHVTLVSRAGAATDLVPWADDSRRLGVAVSRIVAVRGTDRIEIPVDHPMLSRGWHAPEQVGREHGAATLWRWTAGAALLPVPSADAGIVTIEIDIGGAMAYRLADGAGISLAA